MRNGDSPFVSYFSLLERGLSEGLLPDFGSHRRDYLQRKWLLPGEHLTHVMVPFLDGEIEVEVEADPEMDTWSYESPRYRGRRLTRPLDEIRVFRTEVSGWLDDLCRLLQVMPARPGHRECIPQLLWHLGALGQVPVFVAKRVNGRQGEIRSVLSDPIWSPGIVLTPSPSLDALPGGHVARALSDFVHVVDAADRLDEPALQRVVRALAPSVAPDETEQFLQGNRMKLPHFARSRPFSDERAAILKVMWGSEGKAAPILSWAEANTIANTGYTSFQDAFDPDRDFHELFEKIARGKYRLRRKP